MRKFIVYILLIVLFSCCSDSYDKESGYVPSLVPHSIYVSGQSLYYPAESSNSTFSVNSTNTYWIIEKSDNSNWYSIEPTSGSGTSLVRVNTESNWSGTSRVAVFYVKTSTREGWKYEIPITLTQTGVIPSISLSSQYASLPSSGGWSQSINVYANCSWSTTSSASWLYASRDGNTITIYATANDTGIDREAYLYVTGDGYSAISQTITVRQAAPYLNTSTNELYFENYASSADITIDSESAWSASTSDSWIELSTSNGSSGSSTMTVNVLPNSSVNERIGYVYISLGSASRIQIPIHQSGLFLQIDLTNLKFEAQGGSQNLSVSSNAKWTVNSYPSWITLNYTEGSSSIEVVAADNMSTLSRSGEIHITLTGMSLDKYVTISQDGKTFGVGATVLNFEDKESVQSVDIIANGTWDATTNNSWITLSPSTNYGSGALSVSVGENTSDNERTGEILVSMGTESATINVVQKGKYFTISDKSLTFGTSGGTMSISIATNGTWSATVEGNPSWISLSAIEGSGNIDVSITASNNASTKSRNATIVFETPYTQSVKLVVQQEARTLSISTNELSFFAKGGTSELITVSTNGKYQLTCSDSWFTIVNHENNTFKVSASENNSNNARVGKLTISLTDLIDESFSLVLPVIQMNEGTAFIRINYDNNTNYDTPESSNPELNIIKYGSDVNYDYSTSNSSNSTSFSVSNYQTDTNLDYNSSSRAMNRPRIIIKTNNDKKPLKQ